MHDLLLIDNVRHDPIYLNPKNSGTITYVASCRMWSMKCVDPTGLFTLNSTA